MACLPSWLINKYLADLTRVQKQISLLESELDESLSNSEIEEYSFNSTEGQQRTKRRSPKELMKIIDFLESKESRLLRKLHGTSLVNMVSRRKKYSGY